MVTWRKGREIVTRNRTEEEGPLDEFLDQVRMSDPPIHRCPHRRDLPQPEQDTTPLALKADVEHHGIFHEKVLIVSVEPVSVPHVDADRAVGRRDSRQRPVQGQARHAARRLPRHHGRSRGAGTGPQTGLLERNLDLEHASYFVSRITITPTSAPGMSRWRKLLFMLMARNAASPIDAFRLPVERTATVGAMIPI